ncbi:MAG: AzlC family ABC transporter permease [Deltaproteobacteria bacterium]|jgi:4-azaleucine resistance transporter AzlC|nr:AzlC family ABC transporter permease [Deltaproteobacteria bacterium]
MKNAVKAGFPIFIGYIPPAMAFGVLAKTCSITLFECFLFSAAVFAGASQFIALNLLMTGMGTAGIILTTLLVNFRHFLMSAYLSTRIDKLAKKYLALLAFGVTDEVFSVLSFQKGQLSKSFILIVQFSAYSAWVGGSVAGFILGGFLPELLTKSMGVALYSLLLAIILPEVKKSFKTALLVITSGVLNAVLIKLGFLPDGWTIIVCILVISCAGAFFITENPHQEKSL